MYNVLLLIVDINIVMTLNNAQRLLLTTNDSEQIEKND